MACSSLTGWGRGVLCPRSLAAFLKAPNNRSNPVFGSLSIVLSTVFRCEGTNGADLRVHGKTNYEAGEIDENAGGNVKSDKLSDTSSITVEEISKEIHFHRDSSNQFTAASYVDIDAPYGPPLAILLPPLMSHHEPIIQRMVKVYGSKGFDVVSVKASKNQLLYPRREGGAVRTVADFLGYLNSAHRYRPYIVHGFSTGAYIYGEMMAQMCEEPETYRTILENIKGCLWDSPVEFNVVAPVAGKALYPRNIARRWFFERAVSRHFSEHREDSVNWWERSRDNFCRQKCKVPNLFFVSEKDPLSNPGSVESMRILMDQNGIPTFQKTWQDSKHVEHFLKYCDEYLHGMNLLLSLASLFPDPSGKYHSYSTNAHLTSMRLKKKINRDH